MAWINAQLTPVGRGALNQLCAIYEVNPDVAVQVAIASSATQARVVAADYRLWVEYRAAGRERLDTPLNDGFARGKLLVDLAPAAVSTEKFRVHADATGLLDEVAAAWGEDRDQALNDALLLTRNVASVEEGMNAYVVGKPYHRRPTVLFEPVSRLVAGVRELTAPRVMPSHAAVPANAYVTRNGTVVYGGGNAPASQPRVNGHGVVIANGW